MNIINGIQLPVIYNRPIYTPKTFKVLYSNLDPSVQISQYIPTTIVDITLSPNIAARSSHSMIGINNDIYIFGGYTIIINGNSSNFYKITK